MVESVELILNNFLIKMTVFSLFNPGSCLRNEWPLQQTSNSNSQRRKVSTSLEWLHHYVFFDWCGSSFFSGLSFRLADLQMWCKKLLLRLRPWSGISRGPLRNPSNCTNKKNRIETEKKTTWKTGTRQYVRAMK